MCQVSVRWLYATQSGGVESVTAQGLWDHRGPARAEGEVTIMKLQTRLRQWWDGQLAATVRPDIVMTVFQKAGEHDLTLAIEVTDGLGREGHKNGPSRAPSSSLKRVLNDL